MYTLLSYRCWELHWLSYIDRLTLIRLVDCVGRVELDGLITFLLGVLVFVCGEVNGDDTDALSLTGL